MKLLAIDELVKVENGINAGEVGILAVDIEEDDEKRSDHEVEPNLVPFIADLGGARLGLHLHFIGDMLQAIMQIEKVGICEGLKRVSRGTLAGRIYNHVCELIL